MLKIIEKVTETLHCLIFIELRIFYHILLHGCLFSLPYFEALGHLAALHIHSLSYYLSISFV